MHVRDAHELAWKARPISRYRSLETRWSGAISNGNSGRPPPFHRTGVSICSREWGEVSPSRPHNRGVSASSRAARNRDRSCIHSLSCSESSSPLSVLGRLLSIRYQKERCGRRCPSWACRPGVCLTGRTLFQLLEERHIQRSVSWLVEVWCRSAVTLPPGRDPLRPWTARVLWQWTCDFRTACLSPFHVTLQWNETDRWHRVRGENLFGIPGFFCLFFWHVFSLG